MKSPKTRDHHEQRNESITQQTVSLNKEREPGDKKYHARGVILERAGTRIDDSTAGAD